MTDRAGQPMRIAVDAMGGDLAPTAIVEGAMLAARERVGVVLVGVRADIEWELQVFPDRAVLDVVVLDADDVVGMDEASSTVLRHKRRASIRVAADAVAAGQAAALFSAGHTGATVLAAHAAFGMLHGAERPALATMLPTVTGTAVLLDAGANVECRPSHLVRFAVMGTVFARVALGMKVPRVALLSIGEEETKGNDLIREAHQLLKATPLRFIGNLEARDLFTGQADVIVCDGFTGNIALKVGEGLVDALEHLLRDELSRTWVTRCGFMLSREAFRRFRKRVDHSEYGGALLLGVAGLCLVGHGRSSPNAVRNAIVLAARYAEQGMLSGLQRELTQVATVSEV
jgi:glycerol-3-phosphate acyltransferase PlsX